jgi:glycosyltransferase involved in cell wall biosynthesis
MRIVYIAAGAAGSYCGACARDAALTLGLRARGHDVTMVPLYTPLRTEGEAPSVERIFYGGINCYLQQVSGLFRRTPRPVDWLFDRPALLRIVQRYAVSTRPEDLGEMTVSVLSGAAGRQRKELDRLLDFLAAGPRPDVVSLTNSLLVGLAPAIKERLGARLACAFQGEESFVARFPPPHRERAIALMREQARAVDLFLSPGEAYAREMAGLLDVPPERIRVLRAGIDLRPYAPAPQRVRRPFRVGYLSRISPAKGLDVLAEAFIRLASSPGAEEAVLAVAGERVAGYAEFHAGVRARLKAAGLDRRLEDAGELDLDSKARFLQNCSVYCLPSRIEERRAVACLEAMACGLPAVLPERGAFGELIARTGGGVLVTPDDPAALAQALAGLKDDPDRADALGRAAAEGIRKFYSAGAMVADAERIYGQLAGVAAASGASVTSGARQ